MIDLARPHFSYPIVNGVRFPRRRDPASAVNIPLQHIVVVAQEGAHVRAAVVPLRTRSKLVRWKNLKHRTTDF